MAEPSDQQRAADAPREQEEAAGGSSRPSSGGAAVRVALVGGDEPPQALLTALAQRGVRVERTRDVFDAMVWALKASAALRRSAAATSVPTPSQPGAALLLIEPEQLPRAAELARAVRRHAPGVVLWRYDADASQPLRGYDPPAPSAARPAVAMKKAQLRSDHSEPSAAAGPRPHSEDAPRLRLIGPDEEPRTAESAAEAAAPLLSPEELAMLLGDAPPEPKRQEPKP